MIAIQLSLFDTPSTRCRDCCEAIDRIELPLNGLCSTCLRKRPQRRDGSYLTAMIAPADWRDIEPWVSDKLPSGAQKAYPMYYRDEDGIIWEYHTMGDYWRWER